MNITQKKAGLPAFRTSPLRCADHADMRACAKACAEIGFKVFRLPPGKKFPPLADGWQTWQANSPQDIGALWTGSNDEPEHYNIAIQTGLGFFVLDFDFRHGGQRSLDALKPLLPDTMEVSTPGGVHVYLAHDEPFRNGSDIFAHVGLPGVDLRAHHGYVVGPGSIVNDKHYTAELGCLDEIALAPTVILEMIGNRRVSTPVEQTPVAELDSDDAFRMAREWLVSPDGLNGESCDGVTYRTACRLKDFGISKDAAVEMLFAHEQAIGDIGNAEAFQRAIRNAYRYATDRAPGIEVARLPEHEFVPVPGEDGVRPRDVGIPISEKVTRESAPRCRIRLEPWQSLEVRAVEWLVRDLIPTGSFCAIFGRPGSYKSFVALHIAGMLSCDRPVFGKPAKRPEDQPDIVYIAAEGGFGIGKRTAAFDKVHPDGPSRVHFVRHSLDFRSSTSRDAQELVNAIAAARLRPCLVIVDTLARTFAGGAENSPEDMGAYVRVMDSMREALGNCAVLLVHHSGKDQAKGMRGHSSLLGAVDAELELKMLAAVGNGALDAVGAGELRVSKQKDDAGDWAVDYAVQRVVLGWAEGAAEDLPGTKNRKDAITSLAIREWRPGETKPGVVAVERLTDHARDVLEALRDIAPNGREVDFKGAGQAVRRRLPKGRTDRRVWRELETTGAILRDRKRGTVAVSSSFCVDPDGAEG